MRRPSRPVVPSPQRPLAVEHAEPVAGSEVVEQCRPDGWVAHLSAHVVTPFDLSTDDEGVVAQLHVPPAQGDQLLSAHAGQHVEQEQRVIALGRDGGDVSRPRPDHAQQRTELFVGQGLGALRLVGARGFGACEPHGVRRQGRGLI